MSEKKLDVLSGLRKEAREAEGLTETTAVGKAMKAIWRWQAHCFIKYNYFAPKPNFEIQA